MDTTIIDTQRRLFSTLAVDPERNIFYLDPKNLGFGAVCRPLSGGDQGVFDKLNGLLNLAYPNNTLLQITQFASPDVSETLDAFLQLRAGMRDPLLREMGRQRVSFLEECTSKPVDVVSGIKLHDCQLIISVRTPFSGRQPSEADLAKVVELQNSFMQTLRAIGMAATPLTAELYLRFMQVACNGKKTASWRETPYTTWDQQKPLCEQILDADNAIDVDRHGLTLGGKRRVGILTIKRWPEETTFGRAARYLGDIMGSPRGIRENVILSMNVHYPDQESARSKMEADRMWTARQAEGRLARHIPQYGWRDADLKSLASATENGDRIVKAYFSLAVYSDSVEEQVAAVANVRSYFRELNFQMVPDEFMVLQMFLQTLPLAGDEALVSVLQKYRTMATRHVAAIAPVMGAWRGTGTPHLTLYSRDGQLMTVSPFDSNSNFNAVVAASSGSGKSVLTNAIIESMLSTGGVVWAIDIGNSYKNLCELVGGYYMRFTPEAKICLNPFPLVQNWDEEADMIANIIMLMAAPNGGLDNFQVTGIKRVLAEQYIAHRADLSVDLVAHAFLADDDTRLRDIGHQLFSFTLRGEYGRYFNGPNTFDIDNRFVVCELEELKGRKHLQRVVLMQLMYQIGQRMYLGNRDQRKLLVVDEAWDLLATSDTKDFITTSYRRARKYNGATLTITQSISDYWANEGALAIIENSANMYLLAQKKQSIDIAKKESRMPFGEWGYATLETVHTVPGEYSEIFVHSERGSGVGRLVLSDFQKLLFSTRAEEVAAITRLTSRGMPVADAISYLLTQGLNAPLPNHLRLAS